jgi:cyclase
VGGKTFRLIPTPGHSEDIISVYVEEDKVLFASDNVMSVPVVLDGDIEVMKASLRRLMDLGAESIVRGHGEVILRGEVRSGLQETIDYLDEIYELAAEAVEEGRDREWLAQLDAEDSGLSRVALDGRAQQLHTANLQYLYDQIKQGEA